MICFAVIGTSCRGMEDVVVRTAACPWKTCQNLWQYSHRHRLDSCFVPPWCLIECANASLCHPCCLQSWFASVGGGSFPHIVCTFSWAWSIHNRRSAFDCVLRYRLTSILKCLLLLRHSASNHGVREPNLRRICAAEQCLFGRFSNVASSSTDISVHDIEVCEQSGDFQVSLKDLCDVFFHHLLVVQRYSGLGFPVFILKCTSALSDTMSPTSTSDNFVSLIVMTRSSVCPAMCVCWSMC